MKLFHSNTSPFVRKVMVTAMEKGLSDQIEKIPTSPSPISCDSELFAQNPLGKIPCLITDAGEALLDSPVICAYLDSLQPPYLMPADPKLRFANLRLEALADGLIEAGVLLRYETTLRPEAKRWDDWINGQTAKIMHTFNALENLYCNNLSEQLTPGSIACACALGWFDFRFSYIDWRNEHPQLAAWNKKFSVRASLQATQPFV